MDIDPNAWISTVPLTLFLCLVYFQPPENVLKRWWHEILRLDADVWCQAIGFDPAAGRDGLSRGRVVLFWLAVGVLAVGSLASLAAYVGVLPT